MDHADIRGYPDRGCLAMHVFGIAITPNGKTAYIVNSWGDWRYANSVIPIDLATSKALAPIRIKASGQISGLVISPDGGTAYVLSSRSVTPIDTATNKPQRVINLPGSDGYANGIRMTPDGKTIYVLSPRGVIPIRTASRTVLPMIRIPSLPPFTDAFITPGGRTLYVDTDNGVVPISAATNKAGHIINIGSPTWTITFAR